MGRGHESMIRVNDISVSRLHAILSLKHDSVYLQDNSSKFGTLVLLKGSSQKLEIDTNYMFQVGRSVLSFHVTKTATEKLKHEIETESDEQMEEQHFMTSSDNSFSA